MPDLLLIALAGFCASFVDGALGMGFGPTSSTILLGSGLAPAAVSATVNLAKVATGISGPRPIGASTTSTGGSWCASRSPGAQEPSSASRSSPTWTVTGSGRSWPLAAAHRAAHPRPVQPGDGGAAARRIERFAVVRCAGRGNCRRRRRRHQRPRRRLGAGGDPLPAASRAATALCGRIREHGRGRRGRGRFRLAPCVAGGCGHRRADGARHARRRRCREPRVGMADPVPPVAWPGSSRRRPAPADKRPGAGGLGRRRPPAVARLLRGAPCGGCGDLSVHGQGGPGGWPAPEVEHHTLNFSV